VSVIKYLPSHKAAHLKERNLHRHGLKNLKYNAEGNFGKVLRKNYRFISLFVVSDQGRKILRNVYRITVLSRRGLT
jgi:hypothetical protein